MGVSGKGHSEAQLMLLTTAEFVDHEVLEFVPKTLQQWNDFLKLSIVIGLCGELDVTPDAEG